MPFIKASLTSGIAYLRSLGAGGSSENYVPSGVVEFNTTSVGNVGAGEDDLMSYTLPANALNVNGQSIRVTAWGTLAANANTKTVNGKFGATTVVGHVTVQQATWHAEMTITRVSATTQVARGSAFAGAAFGTAFLGTSSPAETLTGAVVVKFTGTSAAAASNDVVQTGMLVEYLP